MAFRPKDDVHVQPHRMPRFYKLNRRYR